MTLNVYLHLFLVVAKRMYAKWYAPIIPYTWYDVYLRVNPVQYPTIVKEYLSY